MRVFHLSGLALVWVDGGTCPARCLTVRIVTEPVTAQSRRDPHILGVAPSMPEARGIIFWIFYPRIRAYSEKLGMDASQLLGVNFQEARRRIEPLEEYSTSVRARALAAFVGVFDFADEDGCVDASSDESAKAFRISRVSWLLYRGVLERAGLLQVDARHGGVRRSFRLAPPVGASSPAAGPTPDRQQADTEKTPATQPAPAGEASHTHVPRRGNRTGNTGDTVTRQTHSTSTRQIHRQPQAANGRPVAHPEPERSAGSPDTVRGRGECLNNGGSGLA